MNTADVVEYKVTDKPYSRVHEDEKTEFIVRLSISRKWFRVYYQWRSEGLSVFYVKVKGCRIDLAPDALEGDPS